MSTLKVDTILKKTGTGTITLGQSGDTISVPTGASLSLQGGSSGQALTTNGSGTLSFASVGGLVLTGSSVSSTAASAITITNCFSATYQNYLVTGSMIPSTDGSNLRFRLHDGSNPLSASSYAYTTHQMRIDSGGVAEATGGSHGASDVQLTSGNNNHISNSAATRMFIFSPAVADYRTTALIDTIGYTGSNDSDRNVQHMKYNVAHTALGITFYTSSGNIDDFDIRVYGMVNS